MNQDDDLLPLLQPRTKGSLPSADVFERTYQVIRFRSCVRRVAKIAVITAIFLSGIGIGWLVKPAPAQPVIENTPPSPSIVIPGDEPVYAALSADQLEQKAELADDPLVVAKFYKLAGDLYFQKKQFDEASRCYRLHVLKSRDTNLASDDSWLLCSVKTSTLKEQYP